MAKILLIEDIPEVAATISAILTSEGHQTLIAPDGKEAFRQMAAGDFDLIITDLFMPGKDGMDVILEVKRTRPATPVVLVTGGGRHFPPGSASLKNLTDSAEILGAVHTLYKPFGYRELLSMVAVALGQPDAGAAPLLMTPAARSAGQAVKE